MMRAFSFCFLCIVLWLAWPSAAHAQVQGNLSQACNFSNQNPVNTNNAPGYTTAIVGCMQTTLQSAMDDILQGQNGQMGLSGYMQWTVGAVITFAVILFGMKILGGEPELLPKAGSTMIRLAIVAVYSYNLGGIADDVFGIEGDLTSIVSIGGGSCFPAPWCQIDFYLDKILGLSGTTQLYQGLTGLVGASYLSSGLGWFLSIAGMIAFLQLLLFIFRIVFVYIMALTVIALLLAMSPLIVPLAAFQLSERYVKKWIDIMISAMLTPMMLFAFLSLFLGVFDSVLANILGILGVPNCDPISSPNFPAACINGNPPNLAPFWRLNQPFFSWLMPADPNTVTRMQNAAGMGGAGAGTPAVPSFINPALRRAENVGIMNHPGIDFGNNHLGVMQNLVYQLITLWIVASLMKTMVGKIPQICTDIAGAVGVGSNAMQPTQIESGAQKLLGQGASRVREIAGELRQRLQGATRSPTGGSIARRSQ